MSKLPHRRWAGISGLIVGLSLVLFGCTATRPAGEVAWSAPEVDLVWPPSPAQPRLRFLRTIAPQDFIKRGGRDQQFFRWLSGEKAQVYPLVAPYGVAADGQGRIWVADPKFGGVHGFDLARNRIDYLKAAGREPLQSPVGVAYDAGNDRLYVSDSILNEVFVFDGKQELLGTRQPAAGYGRPAGLAVDEAGSLYVVDVLKSSIEVFSADGSHRQTLRSAYPDSGGFNRPANVAVDRQGRVYVVDSLNFRVEILRPDGSAAGIVGRLGDGPGAFARPRGVAVDSEGHVYVADAAFDNVQIFDAEGRLLLFFGGPGGEPGEFNLPAGLFFDRHDRLYVVDAYNGRIQLFQYLAGPQ